MSVQALNPTNQAQPATERPAASSLRLTDVSIGYGTSVVLSELDLDIPASEFLVVLGPSGCGKSTLLRTLAGLQRVRSGQVLVDEQPITGTCAERALVFQDDGLLPWRTVHRNVELPLAIRRVPRARRHALAHDWIERVGLRGFDRHLPRELSGGMRQRVQLARTLVGSPRVILMDEPFGSLDAQTRSAMQLLLIDVWRNNPITVVFVTHDVEEALLLADRIVVLAARPGRVAGSFRVPAPRDPRARSTSERRALKDNILAAIGGDVEDAR
jgi:NitT/TauT family transport system ATP-binding protein